jgi:formylglycine-generating enzyme required for sulfatase activity
MRRWACLVPGAVFVILALCTFFFRDDLATVAAAAEDAPPPNPAPGERWMSPKDGMEMVWIPPGQFMMGSPGDEADRNPQETRHQVMIPRGFWMDTSEVTNTAFQKFVKANSNWQPGKPSPQLATKYYLRDWNGSEFPQGKGNHPVTWVSWHAAAAYAEWAKKRLPTEAEWEYACRAGATTAFWWGGAADPAKANNSGETQPVGSPARRNPWGLFDMLGNAWEWCSSRHQPYPYRPDDGREKSVREGEVVSMILRGGGWNSTEAASLRSANRLSVNAFVCYGGYGFRCVR